MNTQHFHKSEFACKCGCGFDSINPTLVYLLECIRIKFGTPITINSGCRCKERNAAVKGKLNSQHLKGNAADIVVKNVEPKLVADYLNELSGNNIGLHAYNTFTHCDCRGYKSRW